MERVRSRARVLDRDPHQDVGRVRLRVVDLDNPVARIEHAGVEQLVLALDLRAFAIDADEFVVREFGLRIVIAPAQPGARGQRVEVPPVVLGVLAMVALAVREAEHPLLEDWVAAVPQRQPEAQPPEHVGQPGHPVLVPAVGSRTGVIVREVRPRVAIGAVVLAHRAPRPLGHVRTPLVPRARGIEAFLEVAGLGHPLALGIERRRRGGHASAPWAASGRAARTTTERGPTR